MQLKFWDLARFIVENSKELKSICYLNINKRKFIGRTGEIISHLYLINSGYKVISRNIKISNKEVDLIAIRERKLYFVEVKTGREYQNYSPINKLNAKKIHNLKVAYKLFKRKYPLIFKLHKIRGIKFSAIIITYQFSISKTAFQLRHIEEYFDHTD